MIYSILKYNALKNLFGIFNKNGNDLKENDTLSRETTLSKWILHPEKRSTLRGKNLLKGVWGGGRGANSLLLKRLWGQILSFQKDFFYDEDQCTRKVYLFYS